jgi:hypothetical protein
MKMGIQVVIQTLVQRSNRVEAYRPSSSQARKRLLTQIMKGGSVRSFNMWKILMQT